MLVGAVLFWSPGASASTTGPTLPEENPAAWSASVGGHHAIGGELETGNLERGFQFAIDSWVDEASEVLTLAGKPAEAARLRREGQAQTVSFFARGGGIDLLDVGDYQPLSAWFATTYKRLRERFSTVVGLLRVLEDLNTLNYAIPVVFHPKGHPRTGETWDALEYRLHFVPFSRVVTYWAAFGACRAATAKNKKLKRYCGRAANFLAQGISRWVAPGLANRIYRRAHRLEVEFVTLDWDATVDRYFYQLQ
jgi:hypothetical protein